MKKPKIYQIPRSDKRKRCNECLRVIKKGQIYKRLNSSMLRFPQLCVTCHKLKGNGIIKALIA